MNNVLSLGFEPLCDSLPADQRNQARENDTTTWLSIHCIANHAKALHLPFKDRPGIGSTN